jgi:hypothetical protein
MTGPWDSLSQMIYPGRLLAVGADRSGEWAVVLYAVTGRSPSSQARRLEREGGAVWTKPTDPETLKKGNPELLVYPAFIFAGGIAVSNGRQTESIRPAEAPTAAAALEAGLRTWSYEPDAPIHTPRISACLHPAGGAALSLIKRAADGSAWRSTFEIGLQPGRGHLVSTYAGDNREPLASFAGEPLDLGFEESSPEATVEAAWAALRPPGRNEDFRVAAACVFARRADLSDFRLAVLNRHERKGS